MDDAETRCTIAIVLIALIIIFGFGFLAVRFESDIIKLEQRVAALETDND